MRERLRLAERQDVFVFDHKPSEVNYGGGMHFHQAAFPPGVDPDRTFETAVFKAVKRFADMLEERSANGHYLIAQREWADIFFDQWCETQLLTAPRFMQWVEQELAAVAAAYRRIRCHAIVQENTTNIPRLNYLVVLALTTLTAEIISDFFLKQIDRLGRLAVSARLALGRSFAEAFRQVESDDEVRRLRAEKLGRTETDPGILRLLNPFALAFIDAGDFGMIDESLQGPNPFQLSHGLRQRLLAMISQVVLKSKKFEVLRLRETLAEPSFFAELSRHRRERRLLVKNLRRLRELRVQLIMENARCRLRQALREYLRTHAEASTLSSIVNNESQLGELLRKTPHHARLRKSLKRQRSPQAEDVRACLREGLLLINRSHRSLFGRLTFGELLWEVKEAMQRLSPLLTWEEDFRLLRSHYGSDSNNGRTWQGLKLWRGFELMVDGLSRNPRESLVFMQTWQKKQADVENGFAEGNLFMCQEEGEIYPHSAQRRGTVTFMFADLRNSTETTMKLNKDTASYLAPYLTAVNAAALACQGRRIYFAGDGYAAYYPRVMSAVRAAASIAGRFRVLQDTAVQARLQKAKALYQGAVDLTGDIRHPKKIKVALPTLEKAGVKEDVREFLLALAGIDAQELSDATVKQLLARVAFSYSMPLIEIGIALTGGELFQAMVGEGDEEKIPIVISPQLTQAARLSGSSEQVKEHIDTHLPTPFLFNVHTWEQKLYNRGIVMTEGLFKELQTEAEVRPLSSEDPRLAGEDLHFYNDTQLNRRMLLRRCLEPVKLKGIEQPCTVYEVALPGSLLDALHGKLE